MAEKLQEQLKELGLKLDRPPDSKDVLMKLLKQAAVCLSDLDQLPLKSVVESMQSFLNAIAKPELLKHQDPEVKLFVAACICEITRITAPEAPYDDDVLKDIFQLIVSTFSGLSDTNDPYFGRRVVILETVARYRSCVVMLDLECDDLINEMFTTYFTVARDEHPENVLTSMQTIMEVVLEESEDIRNDLLLILLSVLGRNKKDALAAARKLAMNVIEHCAGKLEPGIKQFLISSMSGERGSAKCQIDYHEVLYDIYHCAPKILSGVVPYLTGKLLTDQLDIRLKAVSLVGDLFALRGSAISESFQPIFSEFLNRLTDRTVEVRMSVLEHMKICLPADPFRAEAPQMISALCHRLLDCDDIVRKQVVSVLSDLACHALTSVPLGTIKLIAERLRDKSLSVKSYTMERLADIYQVYCLNRSSISTTDEYDWIVGKILRCFYDKDFRSDTIEPILCLSLFPTDFPVKDKVTNWVRIFCGFDKIEVRALEKMLEHKQRLQQEFLKYLSLRQLSQEGETIELQKKVTVCFRVMSSCFTDPAKAEENFQILDQLKDAQIWEIFARLLDPDTSSPQARSLRDDLLVIVGEKHQVYDFLSSLSLKCSYLLFGKEHVKEILVEADIQKSAGSTEFILSCMTILVILASFSPLLLGGIEEELMHLLEDDNEIVKEGVLHILAKAGGTIREQLGVSLRSLDLILERICIEGSRRQAKYAVYALASITKDDGLMSLSVLYKRLVDMLEEKSHLPAVLQSLGCIAQTAMPVFETRESEVEEFIRKNILECSHMSEDKANECWDDRSELCSLKTYGIKVLVKSYLPVKDAHLRSGIDTLVEMLKNILSFGEISKDIKSSSVDKAHLKLAAAKAVLRLSKHWEHKIPVDVFYLTLRTSEANFPEVKKLLLDKVHQYVKDRILDPKYVCAFILDVDSQQLNFEENKQNFNDIIQMCQQGRARHVSTVGDANSTPLNPDCLLPYVVHALSHHSSFPDVDERKDVKAFETIYRQLYLFLSMLVHGDDEGKSDVSINKDRESISLLYSIFLCINNSEDSFAATKSKNSYALCDLGLSIVKRLAPKQDDLQDLSASVVLPSALYKPLEKKGGNDLLIGEGKTWLADESILAHFESLKLEANGIVNSKIVEEEAMKDSETEGSEMPLGKLMKRLKVKASKAKKVVESKSAPAEVDNENNFDILKVVKEINMDNLGITSKLESSNGNEYIRKKKRSDHKPQKRKTMFSESTNAPVPKRKRSSSAQGHKSVATISPKGSMMPTNLGREKLSVNSTKVDEEFQTRSGDKSMQGNNIKPAKSDLLISSIEKKSSPSKQKSKRFNGVYSEADDRSNHNAKKPKKIGLTVTTPSSSNTESGSTKNKKQKSVAGLAKCTAKDNESFADLIGCRIKVWWPMDKMFYKGVVKSFDTEKKKHVILYNDGDVEVLRLDKERWELVDNGQKTEKPSVSSKGVSPKTGSSERKKKSTGGSKQKKKLAEMSPSSQVKRKRTPRDNMKQRQKGMLRRETTTETVGSPSVALTESGSKSIDSDQEQKERVEKSSADMDQLDNDKKRMEDADKGSSDAEESKDEETHSEGIEGSDNGGVSSSDKQQPQRETEEVDSMDSLPTSLDKPKKKIPASSSMNLELSDDETLSTWKQRVGK
ncbi:sister chromatid cohesion protein PDS5 homolog A-B-like isoform X3 [Olea europaea var. sylvestris]|uniref:sister chromatid cohesion protein PDS5 homolog A-B-like isoform X1 n=1 Tax=Olea europaea var. sylvestris TaxID=158386 RepID=UPI000C1D4A7F|nr:sister chromatid cohesion protein PDS5 homolog A-B-like isoform X1 [Olea europaea var. sylvestris]XP_022877906.1 sister chromatid cohesion protein PDS5 homolog A-B-like isoform X2 [Olea europaea var. sylvestris]XP_022877907.1 sister chromatid cohesion protein PDS5 homolog A-B-like isoform X3 [Olea europaea var. sylvestris]